MDKPRWLDEQPEIRQLLHQLIDKLDARPAESRRHPPAITVNPKMFPELFQQQGEQADHLWLMVKQLAGQFHVIEIRPDPKRDPFSPEYAAARIRLVLAAETQLRAWLDRPATPTPQQQWQQAVDRYQPMFPGDCQRLRSRNIPVPGKTPEQVVAAFAKIIQYQHQVLTLRQLSARCFWGLSKFLDPREKLLQGLYPDIALLARPVLVHVHLPQQPQGVLFVENLDSYIQMIQKPRTGTESLILVYSAGFRGAAKRIRNRDGVLLHFHGEDDLTTAFSEWWYGDMQTGWPVWFWGDLDYSGMSILAALKQRFAEIVAWQPGYQPMLQLLRSGNGHALDVGDKQGQVDPGMTGCGYADRQLLPAMRELERFLDQEGIWP